MMEFQAYHCEGDFGAQPLHCHEEVEFVVVTQGQGSFRSGRRQHRTGPGVLAVACPQDVHAGTPLSPEFAVKVLNVSADWLKTVGLDWRSLWHPNTLDEGTAAFSAFFPAYEAVRQPKSRLDQEEALLTLCLAAGKPVVRQGDSEQDTSEPARVEDAISLLRERFAEDISLTALAASIELTPAYFCRAFKAAAGLPPHAYRNSLRVARAKTLLDRGWTPGEAAAEVGFYDQSHLALHFKRQLGVTPAAVSRRAISSYLSPPQKK